MKILSVLNPVLDDYKISGAALQSINLGNKIMEISDNTVDYIANDCINGMIDKRSKYYTIKDIKKNGAIRKTIEYAVNIYKSGEYDIMHINIHQMSVLDSIVNIIPDYVNVVYTQHTSTILGRFSLGYRDSARYLSLSRPNIKIVMPSNYMKDKIWHEYTNLDDMPNVSVIYNGSNNYSNVGFINKHNENYITCSRIDPNKGIKEIAEFCDKYKIPIIIIGDIGVGTLRVSENLENYYNEFKNIVKNSEYIRWLPSTSNENVIRFMSMSKGYICFSKQESFGLTIAEAMSVGLPVFYTSKDSVIEELVGNDYTSTYDGDIKRKSWNNKMNIFYESFKKFDIDCDNNIVRENVMKRYKDLGLSIEDSARSYIKLYQDMLM